MSLEMGTAATIPEEQVAGEKGHKRRSSERPAIFYFLPWKSRIQFNGLITFQSMVFHLLWLMILPSLWCWKPVLVIWIFSVIYVRASDSWAVTAQAMKSWRETVSPQLFDCGPQEQQWYIKWFSTLDIFQLTMVWL